MSKVLVLMSGGVDSSTAAALLKKEGHEVSGVYLKLWEPTQTRHPEERSDEGSLTDVSLHAQEIPRGVKPRTELRSGAWARNDGVGIGDPCWAQEMRDAARAAAHLDIPFQVWDVTAEYKARVLENFYSEYAAGRTPNPDVLCNSEIKFGVGLEKALAAGYDYVATGHYARIVRQRAKSKEQRAIEPYALRPTLYAGIDTNKDQSYFLWRLTQDQLAHTMFPIGDYTKPQVRAMAKEFGLHNWNKKDSQGVCFLGKIELKEFLYASNCHPEPRRNGRGEGSRAMKNGIPPLATLGRNDIISIPGSIVDVHGALLGFHDGLAHFTIGQRQGTKLGGTGPYFVVEKDMDSNTLIVANEQDEPEYRAVECTVRDINWISPLTPTLSHEGRGSIRKFPSLDGRGKGRVMARTRYRAPLTPVSVHFHTLAYESPGRVVFNEPQRAVAPGQSIVFYDGERVIGGGVIDATVIRHPERSEGSPTNVGQRAFARDSSAAGLRMTHGKV